MDQDEDEDLIRNISQLTSGQKKKLKVEEANVLVRRLIQSILVNDELDETIASEMEAESGTENEHESEDDTDTENDPNNTIRSKSPILAINVQSTSGIVPPYNLLPHLNRIICFN